MKHYLIFLFLSLLLIACAKSYIDLKFNEPQPEIEIKHEKDLEDEFLELRRTFKHPS